MKKNIRIIISLVLAICMLIITGTGCSISDSDWPTTDEMIKNLQNKNYKIIEDNKLMIGEKEYVGRVITGTKGSEYVAGFWTDDVNVAVLVYNYWCSIYQSEHTLRVGTTVYSGTNRAIRDAGVKLR